MAVNPIPKIALYVVGMLILHFHVQSVRSIKMTIMSRVKWLGKKLYQVGDFTVTKVLPAVIVSSANSILNSDKATDEQKAKAKKSLARYEKNKKY
jgi:hypothetical protein